MIFKELDNHYYTQANLVKTNNYFGIIIDLFRLLELMTTHAVDIFIDKRQIHGKRTLTFVMFVLHTIFESGIEQYIKSFAQKIQQQNCNIEQFLAPFIGTLVNIHKGISKKQLVKE